MEPNNVHRWRFSQLLLRRPPVALPRLCLRERFRREEPQAAFDEREVHAGKQQQQQQNAAVAFWIQRTLRKSLATGSRSKKCIPVEQRSKTIRSMFPSRKTQQR
mmetsp:Transcript_31941/g.36237  ORF Transcript_31941/g.36237 Transcript_31941/m.36237 type:complete len:104 (+) Transcript_31941:490-801(+)